AAPGWRGVAGEDVGQVGEVVGAVGKAHGGDEVLLESALGGGLHFLDPGGDGLDLPAGGPREEGDDGAAPGGVARRRHPIQVAVGYQADDHGVLRVDVAAEGAGEADLVHAIHAHPVHEQTGP